MLYVVLHVHAREMKTREIGKLNQIIVPLPPSSSCLCARSISL